MTLSPLARQILMKNASDTLKESPIKKQKKEPTAFERASTIGAMADLPVIPEEVEETKE